MKFLHSLFFTLGLSLQAQTNYFVLPEALSIEMTYKMGEQAFIDKFYTPANINGKMYVMRIRKYSWNSQDTAYYRDDEDNFYARPNFRFNNEYIEIPKKIKKGQVWYDKDSSWVYTVKSKKAYLKTPEKKYKKLVVVEAKQRRSEINKYPMYLNYYRKGIGFVGSVVDGKVVCYLVNVVWK